MQDAYGERKTVQRMMCGKDLRWTCRAFQEVKRLLCKGSGRMQSVLFSQWCCSADSGWHHTPEDYSVFVAAPLGSKGGRMCVCVCVGGGMFYRMA